MFGFTVRGTSQMNLSMVGSVQRYCKAIRNQFIVRATIHLNKKNISIVLVCLRIIEKTNLCGRYVGGCKLLLKLPYVFKCKRYDLWVNKSSIQSIVDIVLVFASTMVTYSKCNLQALIDMENVE